MAEDIRIDVIVDLAEVPGWVDMLRDYITLAVARHEVATGQVVDPESQIGPTLAQADKYVGPDGRFIVARAPDSRIVGMVMFHCLASGKAEVKRMFIRPEARRRGLAKRLMARLEAEARAMGLSALYLDTTSGFPEAIALYRSLGFDDAQHDATSVQDPTILEHLVFMEKTLSP